jgi:hypothetical protein
MIYQIKVASQNSKTRVGDKVREDVFVSCCSWLADFDKYDLAQHWSMIKAKIMNR